MKIVAISETSPSFICLYKKKDMIMITNELNTGLIEAIKEKIPANSNLANVLIDILFIGREAVYRRLRWRSTIHIDRSRNYLQKIGSITR